MGLLKDLREALQSVKDIKGELHGVTERIERLEENAEEIKQALEAVEEEPELTPEEEARKKEQHEAFVNQMAAAINGRSPARTKIIQRHRAKKAQTVIENFTPFK